MQNLKCEASLVTRKPPKGLLKGQGISLAKIGDLDNDPLIKSRFSSKKTDVQQAMAKIRALSTPPVLPHFSRGKDARSKAQYRGNGCSSLLIASGAVDLERLKSYKVVPQKKDSAVKMDINDDSMMIMIYLIS